MPRLAAALGGPTLWIKRDDQTGLALGGNKARKLEFILAQAQADGARLLVTTGAVQSNQCRQTAAAAARFGFGCLLVMPGSPPPTTTGNFLVDGLLGAEVVWSGAEKPALTLQRVFDEAWAAGRRPYLIPYGASSPLGAAGYIAAMYEWVDQAHEVDLIVLASSTGGTQAGLVAGARLAGYRGRVLGVSVDVPAAELRARVAELATQAASVWGQPAEFRPDEIEVTDEYIGGGYGVLGDLEREAIRLFARSEGILLDPVYTGRAAGGMLDLIQRGEIRPDDRVLFWHTGGSPALFAYAEQLEEKKPRPVPAIRLTHEIEHGKALATGETERIWGWGTPAGLVRAKRRASLIAAGAGLGPGVHALEIGCGTGVFTEMLAQTGARLTAIDVSAELLAKARARLGPKAKVRFLEKPLEACDGDGPFDAVIGSSILHHLEFDGALRRIRDLLRPGGRISFAEPNLLNPQVFAERRFRRFFPYVSRDETAFVRWRLKADLNQAGFDQVEIAPFDWLHPAVPPVAIKAVSRLGGLLERVPLVREFSGSLHITASRR